MLTSGPTPIVSMPSLLQRVGLAGIESIPAQTLSGPRTKGSWPKVLVTCELTIFGLGSHSATGEEWADNDNAGTAAEAQAFKRACSCFGLGRYLYYFTGVMG